MPRYNYHYHYRYNYNYTTTTTPLRYFTAITTTITTLQYNYSTLRPAVVHPVTTATTPQSTAPTTFRSISGFGLPSMHHNNSPLQSAFYLWNFCHCLVRFYWWYWCKSQVIKMVCVFLYGNFWWFGSSVPHPRWYQNGSLDMEQLRKEILRRSSLGDVAQEFRRIFPFKFGPLDGRNP